MRDAGKTRKQLIAELEALRRQVAGEDVSAVKRRLAVERVRAEAMAMRSSDDLLKVVGVMFQALLNRMGLSRRPMPEGEMFGFERTAEVIRRGCVDDLSAEALLERIMAEVKGFRGETPQGDDQTVVVLKVRQVGYTEGCPAWLTSVP